MGEGCLAQAPRRQVGGHQRVRPPDRLRDGTTDEILAQARDAWEQDVRAGKAALLIAEAREQVHTLNERIRAARIRETTTCREAMLADEHRASAGDWVITGSDDRTLRTLTGVWVRTAPAGRSSTCTTTDR